MKLCYPCTASWYTVLCIHKLWCVSYILYIWRHFVQYKTIVRKTWLMPQQWFCYFFSDSKHCCPLLFSEALLHAQPSPFGFDFPEVLWLCGKYLQLGLVRICLSHIQQTRVMGEREQGALGRFPQNKPVCLIVTTPPAFTHCATLPAPAIWTWIHSSDGWLLCTNLTTHDLTHTSLEVNSVQIST